MQSWSRWVCKHVAALLYNILDYVELGICEIPADKTCTEKPQQWHKPKGNVDEGPVLFSEIQFVHHTYGKRKAEEGALQMEKMKQYRACTSIFSRVTEDSIRELCTSLEAGNNASLFTTMMRSNGCQPLPSTSSETEESTVSQHPSSTPDEIVWNRVTVNSQQAIKIDDTARLCNSFVRYMTPIHVRNKGNKAIGSNTNQTFSRVMAFVRRISL